MITIGSLIGFDSRMPGVLSFVSPVFRTNDLRRAGQHSKDEDGVVSAFRAVPAGRGFMVRISANVTADFGIVTGLGVDAGLRGFDCRDGVGCVG